MSGFKCHDPYDFTLIWSFSYTLSHKEMRLYYHKFWNHVIFVSLGAQVISAHNNKKLCFAELVWFFKHTLMCADANNNSVCLSKMKKLVLLNAAGLARWTDLHAIA